MNLENFVKLVEERHNICLTGGGGVGKSYLIKELMKMNNAQELQYFYQIALTATTGIAGLNIGGQTIHKFAGLGIYNNKKDIYKITNSDKWEEIRSRIQRADIVIIDEFFMLRSDQFMLLSLIFQHALPDDEGKPSKEPFGGKQLILVGDALQLPPVVKKGEEIMGHFAFQTPVWRELDIKVVHLTEVKRQSDATFINALNEVRMGQCSPETAKLFRSRVCKPEDREIISLTPLNKEADEINESRLRKLDTEEEEFFASKTWGSDADGNQRSEKFKNMVKSHFYNELEMINRIVVKEGARVLITSNHRDGDYVNGHLGTYQTAGYVIDVSKPKYDCLYEALTYDTPEGLGWANLKRLDEYTYLIMDDESDDVKTEENPYFSTYTRMKIYYENNRSKKYEFTPAYCMVVRLDEGRDVYVERDQKEFWHPDQESDEAPALTVNQFPIRLGWAISIHKSQGQTLKEAYIEPENIFSYGQFYVALSRVQSLDGIYLKSFSPRKITADPMAINFYRSIK